MRSVRLWGGRECFLLQELSQSLGRFPSHNKSERDNQVISGYWLRQNADILWIGGSPHFLAHVPSFQKVSDGPLCYANTS